MPKDTIIDIYYNPGKTDSIFNYDDNNLQLYINNFNTKNTTNYNLDTIKSHITNCKKYPGKLYKDEYNREGELEHLKNFIINANNNINYDTLNKNNVFRLLSYNVHAFVNPSKLLDDITYTFKKNMSTIDTCNVTEILKMCNNLDPDIISFQEYTPLILGEYNKLNIMNIPNYYINTYIKPEFNNNIIIYKGINKGKTQYLIENNMLFLGNLIMTKFKTIEKYCLSIDENDKHKYMPRNFIGTKININGKEVILFNIHPSPDYEDKNQLDSENFNQIKTFIDLITIKYEPHKYNIIICGDYNNDSFYLKEYFYQKSFVTVHDFYKKTKEYTGYHGVFIDFIYVSLHFLYDFSIVNHNVIKVNYSDHYPVIFDFRIRNNYYNNSIIRTIDKYKYSFNTVLNCYYFKEFKNNNNYLQNNDLFLSNEQILALLKDKLNEIITCEYIQKIISKNKIIIPKDTYLAHGSDVVLDNIGDNFFGFWELIEHNKNIKHDNNIYDIPKSYTLLSLPFESLMSWYGVDTEINYKRLIIYKLTKDLCLFNLYEDGTKLSEKIENRLNTYYELYNHFKKKCNLPDINKLNYLSKSIGFELMRILWIIFNINIHININIDDDKYNENMFYGFVMADCISNDFAILNNHKDHNKIVKYWKQYEMYEGIEIQLFAHTFCTKLEGIYFNNIFYNVEEWKKSISNIRTLRDIKQREASLERINFRTQTVDTSTIQKIINRQIYIFYNFILNYRKSDYYIKCSNDKNLIKQIIGIHDERYIIPKKNYVYNMLINEFLNIIIKIRRNEKTKQETFYNPNPRVHTEFNTDLNTDSYSFLMLLLNYKNNLKDNIRIEFNNTLKKFLSEITTSILDKEPIFKFIEIYNTMREPVDLEYPDARIKQFKFNPDDRPFEKKT